MAKLVDKKKRMYSFSFGDPDPSLTRSRVIGFLTPAHDDYYDLPIPVQGITETLNSSVHHSSALKVKRNLVTANFIEHDLLSRADFSRFVYDYLVFGNAYVERIKNRLGGAFALKPAPSKFVRKHKKGGYGFITPKGEMHAFKKDAVFHLLEPDVNQEIYGLPDYTAAFHSIWLNESATLFRRKYYDNGAHAGYIMYLTDTSFNEEDIEKLQEEIQKSKGPGNFKSLFMYAPDGNKDGLQVIHLSEATAKDQFANIKNISRDDTLAMHRVPPQLMGIVPSNTGGFGSAEDAQIIFERNEIRPLQKRMQEINSWIGEEVVRFEPFGWEIGE
jgi:PBSX family phage portal protein